MAESTEVINEVINMNLTSKFALKTHIMGLGTHLGIRIASLDGEITSVVKAHITRN